MRIRMRVPVSEVVLNPHSSVNPDFAFPDVFNGCWQDGKSRQHWNDAEIAALLDIWWDDKIQSQLDRVYRNDSLFQKIAAAVASCSDTHDPTPIFFFASLESSVVVLLTTREKGVAAPAI